MRFVLQVMVLLVGMLAAPSLQRGRPKKGFADCTSHDQCPTSKSCILGQCGDPCESLCGENSYCTVLHHIPACACKEGHTGNPFIECTLQVTSLERPSCNPGKKKYQIVESHSATWHEALLFCIRNNSRLASIESTEEYGELKRLMPRIAVNETISYWTSGSDAGTEGHYIWASSGKQLSSKSELWEPGEPNNWDNNQHCVRIWFYNDILKLDDDFCSRKRYFICEYFD